MTPYPESFRYSAKGKRKLARLALSRLVRPDVWKALLTLDGLTNRTLLKIKKRLETPE